MFTIFGAICSKPFCSPSVQSGSLVSPAGKVVPALQEEPRSKPLGEEDLHVTPRGNETFSFPLES